MQDTAPFWITEFELACLAVMGEEPNRTLVAKSLGIEALLEEPLANRAGIQTLLVRDQAELKGTELAAKNQSRAIATIMGTAQDAYVMSADGPNIANFISFIVSPSAHLMVTIHPTGVHEARLLTNSNPILEQLGRFATAYDDPSVQRPLSLRIRHVGVDADKGVQVTSDNAGEWVLVGNLWGGGSSGSLQSIWPDVSAKLQEDPKV